MGTIGTRSLKSRYEMSPFKSDGDDHEDGPRHGHHLARVEQVGEEHRVQVGRQLETGPEKQNQIYQLQMPLRVQSGSTRTMGGKVKQRGFL